MMLDAWLTARDSESVRRAWTALAPIRHELSTPPHRRLSLHGAAQLANAMLGDGAEWILTHETRTPDYQSNRIVDSSFVDAIWDITYRCHEVWRLWERRDGSRGLQILSIGVGSVDGQPDGGGYLAVRIFDGERAASVYVGGNTVHTIGDIDLSPLDLFDFSGHSEANVHDVDTLRTVMASLAAEVDPHFASSAQWPETASNQRESDYSTIRHRFASGDRSVAIRVSDTGRISASADGLPWGHRLGLELGGYLYLRLPDALIDRVLARI